MISLLGKVASKCFRIIFIVKTFIIFASVVEGTPILFDKIYKQAFWKANHAYFFKKCNTCTKMGVSHVILSFIVFLPSCFHVLKTSKKNLPFHMLPYFYIKSFISYNINLNFRLIKQTQFSNGKDSNFFDFPSCQIIFVFLWLVKVFFCTPTLLNQGLFELIDAVHRVNWKGFHPLWSIFKHIFVVFKILSCLLPFWRGGLLHLKK